jgi:ABC-type Na+ efflux pump permease subunit
LGIVLPPDFDERLRTDAETPVELSGYVEHWVTDAEAAELQAFFETLFSNLSDKSTRISITYGVYSRTDGGNPFTISLLLTVILTMLSISVMTHLMIEEQETRTMDALLVSPATPMLVLGGKIVAGMFYCLTATTVVLLMNQQFIIHWDVMLLASLSGAIFSAALGTLLGSTLKTKQQVSLWGFILLQPLILPVAFSMMGELFPEIIVTVMRWIPTVALAEVIRLSFVAQAPFSEVALKLLLVIASATVLMSIGVTLAKREET